MGGRGSGRRPSGTTQTTTEDVRRLDLHYLKHHDLLRPGYVGTLSWSQDGDEISSIGFRVTSTHLLLSYQYQAYGGVWEDVEEWVKLAWTPCHYGGSVLGYGVHIVHAASCCCTAMADAFCVGTVMA